MNRWITVLQTGALPLGYCAIFNFFNFWKAVSKELQTIALPLGYCAIHII